MARPRDRSAPEEIDFNTLLELSALWHVAEDEAMVEAYWRHRDEVLDFARPGRRPAVWWVLEGPDDAPQPADYARGAVDDEFERAGMRWLAANGHLERDEIKALLAAPKDASLSPYGREQAELDADAVLEGLAERGDHSEDSAHYSTATRPPRS